MGTALYKGRGSFRPVVDVRTLGKRFGLRWVLRGVSLTAGPGEVVGLLGPNGSGKSTILRVLATVLKPDAGVVTVDGLDVVRDASEIRRHIGYLGHLTGLYDDLTARENLEFAARMLGVFPARVMETLEQVDLAAAADDRVRGFSAGMQRRLSLGRLILRAPNVLLLDEPYTNLDTVGVALVNSVIESVVARGGAVIMAMHELAPARDILDRTVNIANGRVELSTDSVPLPAFGVAALN